MSGTNGVAVKALRLGRTVPDTRPVFVERPALNSPLDDAGQPTQFVEVTLKGYVYGDSTPVSVKAEIALARERWLKIRATKEGDKIQDVEDEIAFMEYKRDILLALVEGLEWPEANKFAGDNALIQFIFEELEFWDREPVTKEAGTDTDADPTRAETSTTDHSSQTSPRHTKASGQTRGSRVPAP